MNGPCLFFVPNIDMFFSGWKQLLDTLNVRTKVKKKNEGLSLKLIINRGLGLRAKGF